MNGCNYSYFNFDFTFMEKSNLRVLIDFNYYISYLLAQTIYFIKILHKTHKPHLKSKSYIIDV